MRKSFINNGEMFDGVLLEETNSYYLVELADGTERELLKVSTVIITSTIVK